MNNADTPRSLDLLDTGTESGGCGGCGCGSNDISTPEADVKASQMTNRTTQSFAVTGMTCGHCASAVTSELKALDGVTDVEVDLVASGTSTVTVTSESWIDQSRVTAALDEAGDYQLAWHRWPAPTATTAPAQQQHPGASERTSTGLTHTPFRPRTISPLLQGSAG